MRSYIEGQCHEFTETVARDMVTDLANALQVRFLLSEIRNKKTVSRVSSSIFGPKDPYMRIVPE